MVPARADLGTAEAPSPPLLPHRRSGGASPVSSTRPVLREVQRLPPPQRPMALGDLSPTLVLDSDEEGPAAHGNCATCLEPLGSSASGRRAPASWPGCGHVFHLSCLARMRAQLHPPACPLCRRPWDEANDGPLSTECNARGINPFQESEAESVQPPLASATAEALPCPSPPPAPWHHRGPPAGPVRTQANSWLYVPLLWAAVDSLDAGAARQWREAAQSRDWWEAARSALATASAVPLTTLRESLRQSLAPGAADLAHQLALAAAGLPHHALVHLGWTLRSLGDADGYIPAAGQEVCLQLFGGLQLAAQLDRHSNAFRGHPEQPAPSEPSAPPSPRPPPPADPVQAVAQSVARRPRPVGGGRGRGRGRANAPPGIRPSPPRQFLRWRRPSLPPAAHPSLLLSSPWTMSTFLQPFTNGCLPCRRLPNASRAPLPMPSVRGCKPSTPTKNQPRPTSSAGGSSSC